MSGGNNVIKRSPLCTRRPPLLGRHESRRYTWVSHYRQQSAVDASRSFPYPLASVQPARRATRGAYITALAGSRQLKFNTFASQVGVNDE